MKRSIGQWAPWISDPDPPRKPMTDAQWKAFVENVARLMKEPPIVHEPVQAPKTKPKRKAR